MVQAPHESRQAKVRHFADQVGVDQHVPSCQVPVDKVSLWEVTHPRTNSSEHPNKLEDAELALILLKELGVHKIIGEEILWFMVKCMMCEVTNNLPKMEIVKSLLLSHPEKGVQGPILHELSDDPLWGVTSNHALQLQYVGMVKLSQDPCFTEEHPLLSVGRPPA